MKKVLTIVFLSSLLLAAAPSFAQNQLGPVTQVVAFSATPTFNAAVAYGVHSIVTSSTFTTGSATAFSTSIANIGTITVTTNFTDTLDIQVNNGTTQGTVQLQAAANGAGTLTIQPGSSCIAQAL
jgi:hypothetical protein